jgi:hypothetical protein
MEYIIELNISSLAYRMAQKFHGFTRLFNSAQLNELLFLTAGLIATPKTLTQRKLELV